MKLTEDEINQLTELHNALCQLEQELAKKYKIEYSRMVINIGSGEIHEIGSE